MHPTKQANINSGIDVVKAVGIEQNTTGIATLDLKGNCLSISQDYARIIGYQPEELSGELLGSLIDIPIKALLKEEQDSISSIKYHVTKNGQIKHLHHTATLICENGSTPSQIISVVQDLTLQKENTENDALAAVAFKHSGDGIVITNNSDTIIRVNPAFTKISGYCDEEIIGKKPFLLRSGEHDQSFYNRIWKTLELEGVWQGEVCYRHKTGRLFYVWETISAVTDNNGEFSHYISILADITEIKKRHQALDNLANYDSLTELPNRNYFEANLTQATEMSKRRGDKVALLFIDLDKFKPINDIYGHKTGDIVLQEVAKKLSKCVRQEDTAARIGGDEFVILMPRVDNKELVRTIAERIYQELQKPIEINAKLEIEVSASIGISIFPDDLKNIRKQYKHFNLTQDSEIMELADLAMYKAKENKLSICFFDQIQQTPPDNITAAES